ncbi:MAG: S8 family serine peptidase, partial [Clostridia bacterium]|nr:S8 family serine peptidase [Clostridia bacterium]
MRTPAIVLILTLCVLFAFLWSFCSPTYAVLPDGYETEVDDGDWYFGEDFLNLSSLKKTVSAWLADTRTYDFSGIEENPIVVAVIDSGVNFAHELFDGFYDENGKPVQESTNVGEYDVFLRDEDGNIVGTNTVTEKSQISSSILDDSPDKHGTHVTGIVATLIHALDLEKYIKIMPIKAAYPKGKNSSFSIEAVQGALDFAISHGADIINMSLSSTAVAYGTAVTNEIADRAVVVAAAGNDSKASEDALGATKYYPAASGNVIGVMNLQQDGKTYKVYSSSNFGYAYDLAAPGYAIWSADGETIDGYKTLNGTSMASPIVAFGAALATLKFRAVSSATGAENKTAREIAQIIRSSHKTSVLHKLKVIKVFDMNAFAEDDGVYSMFVNCEEQFLLQKLGNVKSVEFSASLLPINDENEELAKGVKWYASKDGGERRELATGRTFAYTPENEIGDYEITAEYQYGDDLFTAKKTVRVEYASPSKQDTKIDEDGDETAEYVIGEAYTFEIKNYKDYNPTDTVIWYVNGEYAGNG